jgi:predicted ABC-type ATPase
MPAPRLIFLAGPNGAGKSTYYRAFLNTSGLQFINADELTQKLGVPNAEAARFADGAREAFLSSGESFITETVFSDPVGAKLDFLRRAVAAGYDVQIHFIGLSDAGLSEVRVMQRVLQGGHDVPTDRLERRFRQSLQNLAAALTFVPDVRVFDNSDTDQPYRLVLRAQRGQITFRARPFPEWIARVIGV